MRRPTRSNDSMKSLPLLRLERLLARPVKSSYGLRRSSLQGAAIQTSTLSQIELAIVLLAHGLPASTRLFRYGQSRLCIRAGLRYVQSLPLCLVDGMLVLPPLHERRPSLKRGPTKDKTTRPRVGCDEIDRYSCDSLHHAPFMIQLSQHRTRSGPCMNRPTPSVSRIERDRVSSRSAPFAQRRTSPRRFVRKGS
jgi:hypothetical protein